MSKKNFGCVRNHTAGSLSILGRLVNRAASVYSASGRKTVHVVLTDAGAASFRQPRSNQAEPMRAAVKRANIHPNITFRGLRHAWASHAVMAGGAPRCAVLTGVGRELDGEAGLKSEAQRNLSLAMEWARRTARQRGHIRRTSYSSPRLSLRTT